MRLIRKLLRDERAATAIEYALIAALVVVASIGALTLLASTTIGMWGDVSTNVAGAM